MQKKTVAEIADWNLSEIFGWLFDEDIKIFIWKDANLIKNGIILLIQKLIVFPNYAENILFIIHLNIFNI